MLTRNARAQRDGYPAALHALLNKERAAESRRWLASWPRLTRTPTPLYDLPDLAARLGLSRLSVKDESVRSPLGSFKVLGAPIALVRHLLRRHPAMQPDQVLTGQYATRLGHETVISATDGNHGRALAAAARDAGCGCVIVLHAKVSPEREQAIAGLGARIVRVSGTYDDSVVEAARLAAANGWQVISDTSYDGYEEIPRDVMQGYAIVADEVAGQTGAAAGEPAAFSHVLLQGGVGGFAAGVVSWWWEHHGAQGPRFIVVEPEQADCLFQSARTGRATRASGSTESVMAGLACGESSPLAWRVLALAIDQFATVADDVAVEAMRRLARGSDRDVPIVAGESGAAGLAGAMAILADGGMACEAGLDGTARVLVVNTEGATAPGLYRELVGDTVEAVAQRQAEWLRSHAPGA